MAHLSKLTTSNSKEFVDFIKNNSCEEIHCDISGCAFLVNSEIGMKLFVSFMEKYGHIYSITMESLLEPNVSKVDDIKEVSIIGENTIEIPNEDMRLIFPFEDRDEFIKFVNLMSGDHVKPISDADDIVYSAINNANILGAALITDNVTAIHGFIEKNPNCEIEIDLGGCCLITHIGLFSDKLERIIVSNGYIEDDSENDDQEIFKLDDAVTPEIIEDGKVKFIFEEDIVLRFSREHRKSALFIIEKIISGVIEVSDDGDEVCYTAQN